jgi:hypothetical protein
VRWIAAAISAFAFLAGLVWAEGTAAAPPPDYDFTVTPAVPVAGQPAAFTATGLKPKDTVAWDFENDGVFDATGTVVQHVYPTSGQRLVLMRVTKDDGEIRTVLKPVVVEAPPPGFQPPVTEPPVPAPGRPAPVPASPVPVFGVFPQQPTAAPLELMSPFPIIRIVGRATRRGATIRLLAVRNAPLGARVTVRCRGRGCPVRSHRRWTDLGRARLRPLERSVRAGTLIRIYVTQPGKIGKYTSFTIRRARRPLRRDRCTQPGIAVARPCPAS